MSEGFWEIIAPPYVHGLGHRIVNIVSDQEEVFNGFVLI